VACTWSIFLASYWSARFGTFLLAPPLLLICRRILQTIANSRQTQQAKQLLSLVNYTPLVISNSSQKQASIIMMPFKFGTQEILQDKFFLQGHLKNLKTCRGPYLGLDLYVPKSQIYLVTQSL
jgi:hypothetical protein